MINLHRSISEEYDRLCVRYRQLSRETELGDSRCVHCRERLANHYRGKCSMYATSLEFTDINADEFEKLKLALELMEKLMAIPEAKR